MAIITNVPFDQKDEWEGTEYTWEFSVLNQFCYAPKSALKSSLIIKKKFKPMEK